MYDSEQTSKTSKEMNQNQITRQYEPTQTNKTVANEGGGGLACTVATNYWHRNIRFYVIALSFTISKKS